MHPGGSPGSRDLGPIRWIEVVSGLDSPDVAEDPASPPLLQVDLQPGSAPVIALRGDLDPHTAPLLEAALADLGSGPNMDRVVIDLGGISFIDSSGLRVFVTARASLADAGIELALRNPSANTRRLLDITGLGELITVE